MRQILFTVPLVDYPLTAFGAMLFVTFVMVVAWGGRRAFRLAGLSPERFQDMAICLFATGIVGARLLYMVQYSMDYPDKSARALLVEFVSIWNGGIVFYGSAFGGAIGYGLFYWFVLRRMKINGWQLADAVAPLLAMGLAIGRIGCYLNGCCWGQVACEGATCPVPLGAAHFPLLPTPARELLVFKKGYQTSTGFTLADRHANDDPRSVVAAVEPGSAAAAAGLKPGDRVVRVNGEANAAVLELGGSPDAVAAGLEFLKARGAAVEPPAGRRPAHAAFDQPTAFLQARLALDEKGPAGLIATPRDTLGELVGRWPRGENGIELAVQRDGKEVGLPAFSPRTIGLYPTQLYETVSMVLLIGLLLAYYPFRRHDGQLFTLLLVAYAVHRFVNESLRIEPDYAIIGLRMTLSQWLSVVILGIGVGLELYLWRTSPSRWRRSPTPQTPTPPTANA